MKKKINWSAIWKQFNKFHNICEGEWSYQKAYLMLAINLNVKPKDRLNDAEFEEINKQFTKKTRRNCPDWSEQKKMIQTEVEKYF